MKLFVIKIVANNFLGFSSSFTIISPPFPPFESLFKSVWESEKKATSVPEINAELKSKAIKTKALITFKKSIEVDNRNKGSGSGSKF